MATDERAKELIKALHDAVYSFEEERAMTLARAVLSEGIDPFTAAFEGLASGMTAAGEAFVRKEYFVPELLMCSDALNAGLGILKTAIEASGRKAEVKGSIVLGVVEGDVHDIGKNLVKLMFDVAGWQVYDLGNDVPISKFAEEQRRTGAALVGLSAMMTTSMLNMPKIIKQVKASSPEVRILIGGAPVSPELAQKFGADGYAATAVGAVEEGTRLFKMP